MTEPAPSHSEIRRLLGVAARQAADSDVAELSSDGSFEHAYSAALAVATAVIRAEGQRIHGLDHHRLTFEAVAEVAAGRWKDVARYLQHCRVRRNRAVYDVAGTVSAAEAEELRNAVATFTRDVEHWLDEQHPDLR